ncbi:MAG: Uma2 family endonuclease [Chitinophagaceae bacterium]|nr:Uma2 family endonuclease [Chitinophagaceae bacterium]
MLVEEPYSEYGFTYADYLTWNFKERLELINGQLFKMSPAPTIVHQRISYNLEKILGRFVENHDCSIFHAPIDVKLKGKGNNKKKLRDEDIITVVQPDIIIVCDEEKLKDGRAIDGAPDLVVEILSPGNTKTEMKYKLELYEENEVKEYWVVYPEYKQVAVFRLNSNMLFEKPIFFTEESVISFIFPALKAPLHQIFITK